MGLLSTSASICRYRVQGKIDDALLETVTENLKKNKFAEIDDEPSDLSVGWTTMENPYAPDFDSSTFLIGTYFVFSLRIDKKSVPSKIVKKHVSLETNKRLAESGKEFLSRNEKQQIKDQVTDVLTTKIPATPSIYDLIWNYEDETLLFFSTQKAANEELETLFNKSFKLTLVRLFPYTIADLTMDLTDKEHDILSKLSPTRFTE